MTTFRSARLIQCLPMMPCKFPPESILPNTFCPFQPPSHLVRSHPSFPYLPNLLGFLLWTILCLAGLSKQMLKYRRAGQPTDFYLFPIIPKILPCRKGTHKTCDWLKFSASCTVVISNNPSEDYWFLAEWKLPSRKSQVVSGNLFMVDNEIWNKEYTWPL